MPRTDAPILTWDQLLAAGERLSEPARVLLRDIVEEHRPAPGDAGAIEGTRWFLESLAVEGFVGIGSPEVVLSFEPGPGLTVVTARNGVGKSSFALALRHLLGGARLTAEVGPSPNVRWRNILAERLAVSAAFREVGSTSKVTVAERGEGPVIVRGDSREPLGRAWVDAKTKYEPVLIYPEIAQAIDDERLVNDAWANALPLEVLRTAHEAARRIEKQEKENTKGLDQTLTALRENPDLDPDLRERLPRTLPPKPDDVDLARLAEDLEERRAANREERVLYPEVSDSLAQRLDELRSAVKDLEGAHRREAAYAWSLVRLYREALGIATEDDEEPCLLCGSTTRQWRARTEHRLSELETDHDGTSAVERIHHARDRAVGLLPDYTRVVGRLPGRIDERVRRLANRWRRIGHDLGSVDIHAVDLGTIDRLRRRLKGVAAEHERLREEVQARSESAPGSDARTMLANFLRDLDAHTASLQGQQAASELKRRLNGLLRKARDVSASSLGEQARAHFERLCPDSAVKLLRYTVAGGIERSRQMNAAIRLPNGEGGEGTEILSTGQLNALCLSAFLPRTTRRENPFGFLVLDDPIQAFDGARVAYLAEVLADTSADYQVIVFTHDERLPTVLASAGIGFRRIDLTTNDGGVQVKAIRSPAQGLLEDAREIAGRSDNVADSSLAVATLALSRQAVDEAIGSCYLRQQFNSRRAVSDDTNGDRLAPEGMSTRDRWESLNDLLREAGENPIPIDNELLELLNHGGHFQAPKRCDKEVRRGWVHQTEQLVERLENATTT